MKYAIRSYILFSTFVIHSALIHCLEKVHASAGHNGEKQITVNCNLVTLGDDTVKLIEKSVQMIEENTCVHFYRQNETVPEDYDEHFVAFYTYGKQ